MDFRIQVTELKDLHKAECDALLIVVGEGTRPEALGKALGSVLGQALQDGDLAYKSGRCLYLHRPAGVTAARVVFAAAGGTTPKAFRAALSAALALLKGGGAQQLLVACALPVPIQAAQAQLLAPTVSEALYVYRHTKRPSRWPPAKGWPWAKRWPRAWPWLASAPTGRATTARPPTWPPRPAGWARRTGSTSRCSSARTSRSSAWVASWPWRRAPARRRSSSCCSTAGRPSRWPRWCWWARASPSTPVASRSSPRPRWTR